MLPIIADESCLGEEDVARCAKVFDGINIKLTKAGGMMITPDATWALSRTEVPPGTTRTPSETAKRRAG